MSVNYQTPMSAATLNSLISADSSITSGTTSALFALLGNPPPSGLLNVGSSNGVTTTAPNATPQVVITTIGDFLGVFEILNQWIKSGASGSIFSTNSNIKCNFGDLSLLNDSPGVTRSGIDRVVSSGNGNDELTFGDNGDTTVDGSVGNDTIITSGGFDSITGGTGNDSIFAGSGNDTIVTGVGSDTVNGGLGFDAVQVTGTPLDWTTSIVNNRLVITSTTTAGNTVNASNVDFISFTGATGSQYSIVVSGTVAEANTMRLYQGLLDRSADQGGAEYWQAQVRAGASPDNLANAFMSSAEYIRDYGTQTNTQFVAQIYENTFGRTPDAAGLAYWLGTLQNGATRAGVAVAIVGCPEAVADVNNVILLQGSL